VGALQAAGWERVGVDVLVVGDGRDKWGASGTLRGGVWLPDAARLKRR
jgi:hypothetical protein